MGRLDEHELESDALRGNRLGDPHRRPLWVYAPPGADETPLPAIYLIQGHTGQVDMWRNRSAFRPNVLELVDALFADDGCPPALVVFVDAWTSYGGSQFLDSPGVGNYHTYLCDEVVAVRRRELPHASRRRASRHRRQVERRLRRDGDADAAARPLRRARDARGRRALRALLSPDVRDAVRALRDAYDGSFDAFWKDFRSRPAFTKGTDFPLLNIYAMAACYSANEDGTVDLPFDTATGQLDDAVWARWLAWDPVRMVDGHADALRGLRAIYIDSGKRDQFYLDLGAEGFRRALERIGVTDVFFELFDGTHSSIEYRYPVALRYLAERLQPT